ncbi:MAG: YncE family protein [Rhizobiaceae bacterium]
MRANILAGLALAVSFGTPPLVLAVHGAAAASAPLQLVQKIPLGEVKGRIDHMAVDLTRQRLFVAVLGNDSVGVVNLKASQVSGRIHGLKEPQGIGYLDANDTLYMADAGDGTVRLFRGRDFGEAGRIRLGEDADNIRIDHASAGYSLAMVTEQWPSSMPQKT